MNVCSPRNESSGRGGRVSDGLMMQEVENREGAMEVEASAMRKLSKKTQE